MKKSLIIYGLIGLFLFIVSCNTQQDDISGLYVSERTNGDNFTYFLLKEDTLIKFYTIEEKVVYVWSKEKKRYYSTNLNEKGGLGYSFNGEFYKLPDSRVTYKTNEDKIVKWLNEDLTKYSDEELNELIDMHLFDFKRNGIDTLNHINSLDISKGFEDKYITIETGDFNFQIPKTWKYSKSSYNNVLEVNAVRKSLIPHGVKIQISKSSDIEKNLSHAIKSYLNSLTSSIRINRSKSYTGSFNQKQAHIIEYWYNIDKVELKGKAHFLNIKNKSVIIDFKGYEVEPLTFERIETSFPQN